MTTKQEALVVLALLVAMGFAFTISFLAGRTRVAVPVTAISVPVTAPLAVLVPPKPVAPKRVKRFSRNKIPVVVIPVVVGAASCPELDDGTPCRELYDFRQRCSANLKVE